MAIARRMGRIAVYAGLCAVVVVAGILGLAYGAFRTDAGREMVASWVGGVLSEPGQSDVTLTGLTGALPRQVRAASLTVGDSQGPWLLVVGLAVDWDPLALLTGKVRVDVASAKRITLLRLPVTNQPSKAKDKSSLPLFTKIRIGKILVDEVDLKRPVLGAGATLRVQGSFAFNDTAGVTSSLSLDRTDGPGGHVHATAIYVPASESLTLDVSASEPAGGLAARLIDLPGLPALAMKVSGKGPLRDWSGNATASASGLVTVDAALAISGAKQFVLNAKGKATPGQGLESRFRDFARPAVSFDAALAWTPGTSRIDLRKGDFSSDSLTVSARGTADVERLSLSTSADLRVTRPALLQRFTAPMSFGGVSLNASVDGTVDRLAARGALTVSSMRGPGFRAAAGEVRLSATPLGGKGQRWRIEAESRMEKTRFDEPALAALVGQGGTAKVSGEIDSATGVIDRATLRTVLGNLTVSASGHGNLKQSEGIADLDVSVGDLSALSAAAEMPLSGSAALKGRIAGDSSGATGKITGKFRGFSIGEPALAALLGDAPEVSGNVRLRGADAVDLSDVWVRGQATRATLEYRLAAPWREATGRYRLEVEDVSRFARSLDVSATGKLTSEGMLAGRPDNPTLTGTLAARAATIEGVALSTLRGRYSIATPFSRPDGRTTISADTPFGRVEAASRLRMIAANRLRFTGFDLRAEGVALDGDFAVSTRSGIAEGRLSGKVDTAAARWLPVDAEGALDLGLTLQAKENKQATSLEFTGRNITLERTARLGDIRAALTALGLGRNARLNLDAGASKVAAGSALVDSFTVAGSGQLDRFDARVAAKGTFHGPLDISAEGTVRLIGKERSLSLRKFEGSFWKQPVKLDADATVALHHNGLELSLDGLSWGGGVMVASARTDRDAVSASASVKHLPVSALARLAPGIAPAGTIDLEAQLNGAPADPEGEARLDLRDVKLSDPGSLNLPPLSGSITARLRGGRLTAASSVSGIGDRAIKASADIPLRLDARALTASVASDEAVRGNIEWKGDIGAVSLLAPLPDHRFSGSLTMALNVSGTVERPAIKGNLAWRGGEYENIVSGTILKKIDLDADADGERVAIRRATAEDGNGGRATVTGTIGMGPEMEPALDLRADLRKFTLVRRDELTASVNGEVALTGELGALAARGRLETTLVEARIMDGSGPEIYDLQVIDVHGGQIEEKRPSTTRKRPVERPLSLDVEIVSPRRVFLRGRGLDSEWAGKLNVSGTADAPIVKGTLRPVRGQFELVGKVFKLGQGSVTFEGKKKIDPVLDITAVHTAKQVTATIRVTGTASKPALKLTSVPELPQDEILSRVLFDKSVGRLSPGEGVQLAAAVASLTGLDGGGPGILDRVRKVIGVDTLRIGKKENGETTVGVGKYIAKEVYVGVDQGATQKSGNVTVEVTVAPNVTVKSDIGADSQGKVGINWKWDY